MARVSIERVMGDLPQAFDLLSAEARDEGFGNMDKLARDWRGGAERFDKVGEALFAAFVDGDLAGIGGLTREPSNVDGDILRARRFYISPRFRGQGVGKALAAAIKAEALRNVPHLVVHAAGPNAAFWDAVGFARINWAGVTHGTSRDIARAPWN